MSGTSNISATTAFRPKQQKPQCGTQFDRSHARLARISGWFGVATKVVDIFRSFLFGTTRNPCS
jgi:hypothetical protein